MFPVYTHDPSTNTYWRVQAPEWAIIKYDNSALVSIGWTVGTDLPRRVFDRMTKTRITKTEWDHGGCQSSCIRRGQETCRW